jgi:hypothetical protein
MQLNKIAKTFPRLEDVTSPIVNTPQMVHYLNRAEQTDRLWACKENGPLKPIRIHGRLGWRVSDIKQLLGVA